jgi:hypothetical protein
VLIVTNGTSAVANLEVAAIPGDKLPWDDVLHDGPVPDGLTLPELSVVRARFIGDPEDETGRVRESFRGRDERLARAVHEDEVVLWFEHDLYDQLQLIQLLDWLGDPAHRPPRCTLICRAAYVSEESGEALRAAFAGRDDVTPAQLALARRAWNAFRRPQPRDLAALLGEDTGDLPFVRSAIRRFLEEYPWRDDGLSRTERQALSALREHPGATARELFELVSLEEDPKYLGDLPFFGYLENLKRSPYALLTAEDGDRLRLTSLGEDVLDGKTDRVRVRGLERWYGGVRLTGGNVWRWNPETATVFPI